MAVLARGRNCIGCVDHLILVFRVRGLVLGDFADCEEKDATYTSAEVLGELAEETGLPCAAGFAFGHGSRNAAIPLGCRARLVSARRFADALTLNQRVVRSIPTAPTNKINDLDEYSAQEAIAKAMA